MFVPHTRLLWARNIVTTVYRVRPGHDTDIKPCSLASPVWQRGEQSKALMNDDEW